jgi:hypothetical protein
MAMTTRSSINVKASLSNFAFHRVVHMPGLSLILSSMNPFRNACHGGCSDVRIEISECPMTNDERMRSQMTQRKQANGRRGVFGSSFVIPSVTAAEHATAVNACKPAPRRNGTGGC